MNTDLLVYGKFILHNSTLYLIVNTVVQLLLYFFDIFSKCFFTKNFFFKFLKKKTAANKSNPKSQDIENIVKQIDIEKENINKYNKIIADNCEKNKHLGEYDLFILNGKYTRQVLKHQKALNELIKKKKELTDEIDKNKNWFLKKWNLVVTLIYSENKILMSIKKQLGIILIYILLKYVLFKNAKLTCFKLYSTLEFTNIYDIVTSEICKNNTFLFLINYNLASTFIRTTQNYIIELFAPILKKSWFKSKLKKE